MTLSPNLGVTSSGFEREDVLMSFDKTSAFLSDRNRLSDRLSRGLTILELLLALAVLSIILVGLAYVLTSNIGGVRSDGFVTAANQAGVSVVEGWRARIVSDTTNQYDSGVSGTEEILVDGVVYVGSYQLIPQVVDSSGQRSGSSSPDVFEVRVLVALPDGGTRTYSTVVAKRGG